MHWKDFDSPNRLILRVGQMADGYRAVDQVVPSNDVHGIAPLKYHLANGIMLHPLSQTSAAIAQLVP